MTTVLTTNNTILPFIEVNVDARTIRFEYGTQLIEYAYLVSGEFNLTTLIEDIQTAITEKTLHEFIKILEESELI